MHAKIRIKSIFQKYIAINIESQQIKHPPVILGLLITALFLWFQIPNCYSFQWALLPDNIQ